MKLFGNKKEEKDVKPTKSVVSSQSIAKKSSPVKETATADAKIQQVLVAPIVTEKAHALSQHGKYIFRVAKTAHKRAIAKVVGQDYDVTVENVNIISVPRKRRTVKGDRGYQSAYKKAIVTLKKGESIALFEAV